MKYSVLSKHNEYWFLEVEYAIQISPDNRTLVTVIPLGRCHHQQIYIYSPTDVVERCVLVAPISSNSRPSAYG